jgi:hypothetical protein
MNTDLTIGLAHRPGTLAAACDALGHAGVNIEAASGHVIDGRPELHILVADASLATRALIDAGFEIRAQRQVLALPVENRAGAAARLLRRIADAEVSVDLVYTTLDGRLVLGSDDLGRLRAAIG